MGKKKKVRTSKIKKGKIDKHDVKQTTFDKRKKRKKKSPMKVNKRFISLIGILCLLLLPQSLFSQGSTASQDYLTIQGIVHDEIGEPLQFVYVTVKGFNLATVTNQSGEFTLKIENEMATGEKKALR